MSNLIAGHSDSVVLSGLTSLLHRAAHEAGAFVAAIRPKIKARIVDGNGKIDRGLADMEQNIVHGFGWYATYATLMQQVTDWATSLHSQDTFGETEALLAQLRI